MSSIQSLLSDCQFDIQSLLSDCQFEFQSLLSDCEYLYYLIVSSNSVHGDVYSMLMSYYA
jgi:hypothetical protein